MSILINMEMPKDCKHCKFRKTELQEDPDWCLISGESLFYLAENDCPLIEVSEYVRPVEYGEWTAEGNDEYGNYWDECTACRKSVWFPPSVNNDYKYCPHCGAKMDGGDA